MEKVIRFTKMHGAGNDYIYINCFTEHVEMTETLARKLSHRHFGIGADGIILICPSDRADVEMKVFNADGTPSEMCGNGLRCVAKYAADYILAKTAKAVTIESHGRLYSATLTYRKRSKDTNNRNALKNEITGATVDMGPPVLEARKIPVSLPEEKIIEFSVNFQGRRFGITCVNMGNPHTVIYVDNVKKFDVEKWGKAIENDPRFPERTNVHFVQPVSKTEVTTRTWERGSGETFSCGSGSSAICVAGILTGRTAKSLVVHFKGGDHRASWKGNSENVFLTGPAEEVFQGEIRILCPLHPGRATPHK